MALLQLSPVTRLPLQSLLQCTVQLSYEVPGHSQPALAEELCQRGAGSPPAGAAAEQAVGVAVPALGEAGKACDSTVCQLHRIVN